MRYLLTCFVLSILLLQGCSGKDEVPRDIIPPAKMQQVVWDILQADELAMQNKLADSSVVLQNESFRLYDQVFAIHRIDRARFYKSYRYYQEHPALYKSLMERVKATGDKEKKAVPPLAH